MFNMIFRFLNFAPMLLIIIMLHVFTPILSNYYYYWDMYLAPKYSEKDVFDFIVIGAGSSGSVIANRLSKNNKVLLIEAGGDPGPFISIPILAQEIMHMPQFNWNHRSVAQKYSHQGMTDKVSLWPRGKVLGGTTNLNFMFYVRGHPLDYDKWANLTGDDRWKYENILPYFKKSLDYHGAYSKNDEHYGQSAYGHLHVERREWAPLYKYFIDACKELGYPEVDINGPQVPGFGPSEVTQKIGSRHGTYAAFLKNILHRKNLHISRYSQAIKIKLDKNNQAEGVWYVRHGKKYFAKASKEIIVSGGTVDSAKLLLLSGIGPKDHLKSLNIKPKINLPVGQNLVDHLAFILYPFLIDQKLSTILPRDFGAREVYEYFVHGSGPMTSPGLLNSHGFIATKFANKNHPDLQIYLSGAGIYSQMLDDLHKIFGYNKTTYAEYIRPLGNEEKDAFSLMIVLVRPQSVGQITLKDKNPFSPPLIDPRYLEDDKDIKTLVEGIKISLKMGETNSFKKLNTHFVDLTYPACKDFPARSDEYWSCLIRNTAFTLYHPVGTVRMGKSNDPKAVVDSKLRVLNTINFRVADASIMPVIVNGNTNAPTIMIGEVVSDLIREYWTTQYSICHLKEYLIAESYHKAHCSYSQML